MKRSFVASLISAGMLALVSAAFLPSTSAYAANNTCDGGTCPTPEEDVMPSYSEPVPEDGASDPSEGGDNSPGAETPESDTSTGNEGTSG